MRCCAEILVVIDERNAEAASAGKPMMGIDMSLYLEAMFYGNVGVYD